MSQENVEAILRGYEAFIRRYPEGANPPRTGSPSRREMLRRIRVR